MTDIKAEVLEQLIYFANKDNRNVHSRETFAKSLAKYINCYMNGKELPKPKGWELGMFSQLRDWEDVKEEFYSLCVKLG